MLIEFDDGEIGTMRALLERELNMVRGQQMPATESKLEQMQRKLLVTTNAPEAFTTKELCMIRTFATIRAGEMPEYEPADGDYIGKKNMVYRAEIVDLASKAAAMSRALNPQDTIA